MLKQYFKLDLWSSYLLALTILIISVLFLGMIGPFLISAKSTILVWMGVISILLLYPFLVFIFARPLFKKLMKTGRYL